MSNVAKQSKMATFSLKGEDGKSVELSVPGGVAGDLSKQEPFLVEIVNQAVNISSRGRTIDKGRTEATLSAVAGIAPSDAVEVMLALQLAAVHNASMTFARRLAHIETVQQQDSAARAFNQLCRTFAAQVEALKRYRSSGQQVTVKHVTVNDGGKAIVGNVNSGGG